MTKMPATERWTSPGVGEDWNNNSLHMVRRTKIRMLLSTLWPSNFTHKCLPKKNENIRPRRLGASQVVRVVKNPHASAGLARDVGLIPGFGRSHGGLNGIPLQYSCLENPTDRWAWQATAHAGSKSHPRLNTHKALHVHSSFTRNNHKNCKRKKETCN